MTAAVPHCEISSESSSSTVIICQLCMRFVVSLLCLEMMCVACMLLVLMPGPVLLRPFFWVSGVEIDHICLTS